MSRGLRRGASAVEFVLVSAMMIPLLVGTIEVSWYLATRVAVEHCVRDAARAGADVCDPANCNADAGGECQFCLSPPGSVPTDVAVARFTQCWADASYPGTATATATTAGSGGARDRRMTVTGSVTYAPIAVALMPDPVTTAVTFRLDDQSF